MFKTYKSCPFVFVMQVARVYPIDNIQELFCWYRQLHFVRRNPSCTGTLCNAACSNWLSKLICFCRIIYIQWLDGFNTNTYDYLSWLMLNIGWLIPTVVCLLVSFEHSWGRQCLLRVSNTFIYFEYNCFLFWSRSLVCLWKVPFCFTRKMFSVPQLEILSYAC